MVGGESESGTHHIMLTLTEISIYLVYMSNKALGTQFHNQVIPQFVQLRKKLNISQLEMDEILGVAKGLVSKWECGIRKPSGWLFCCWAEALNAEIIIKQKEKHGS